MRKILLLVILCVLGIAGLSAWWMHRWPDQASLQRLGSPLRVLATPAGRPHAQVLVAVPADQALSDETLLDLARRSGARLLQFPLPDGADCRASEAALSEAIDTLGEAPDMVAGIGPGGVLAWRWLAHQDEDDRSALSVGVRLGADPKCGDAWPEKAAHGQWHLAWNDNPGDDTAVFVRNQPNADTVIADYGTPLTTLLREQLQRRLLGQGGEVPTIEVPVTVKGPHADTVTFFYSGDGGWRDLDRASAQTMAAQGFPVVGVDTLRYFWEHKSPERVATDLSRLMQDYRQKWGARHFVLAGYSFGADILPAVYNRLPAEDQAQVSAMLLLAFARSGNFEIQVQGWLGQVGDEAQTGPEMARLPAQKVYCIYGSEEKTDSGCTQPGAVGERLELPGGHHYDGDYDSLAGHMMKAIESRTPAD